MKDGGRVKIAIMGGPRTGKTTLSEKIKEDMNLYHTDDIKDLPWSEQSDVVCDWFTLEEDCIIEGVTVVRALRKFLEKYPHMKPCDKLIILTIPYFQTDGQEKMSKGHDTILNQILPVLDELNVEINYA